MSLTDGQGRRITMRFPSGAVEHRYGQTVPEVGDEIELDGERGVVRSVEALDGGDVSVELSRPSRSRVSRASQSGTDVHEAVPSSP